MSQDDIVLKAIEKLGEKNKFTNDQLSIEVIKIYPRSKYLALDWWKGKTISLIAEDSIGNYIIRHSSGIVSYLDLNKKAAIEISKSVKDFMLSLY